MRAAFSDALVAAAKANPKILLLTGDHGYALFDAFRKECPQQYINCGIAEQNMVGVAAGLAKAGFIPFVYGLSAFVPIRVLEQIKIDVCYESLKVIFIGDGAGVVYSHLGSSHQSTEDIAALRAIPNLNILSPADPYELSYTMSLALNSEHATYLRMGKADLGEVHSEPVQGDIGALMPVQVNPQAKTLILATGSMVSVGSQIAKNNPNIDLYSVPSIKPINASAVLDICAGRNKIYILEEHSIYGGLGSCIAEIIAGKLLCDFKIIGIKDRFSERCGDYAYLMEEHGLNAMKLEGVFL
ncbi:transketolase family protein [Janthinobacterium sp. B9-8]|uniref:transketolase family protein n=1 Tax=Janthinobacterium sp. B9-8 TaxID=1236179 RepID=UPI00061CF4D9|nr:transketolase C-terminal domain-containing protein [Janthinobacterium sp. B9-8]AMC36753.1 transketolase [Janthinobacterium sp. B9-8]